MAKQSFKNFIAGVLETSKKIIAEVEKTKGLTGAEKKQRLDDAIVAFIQANISKYHFFVRFAINKLVIPYVSEFTQAIFDLLKARIKGVTEESEKMEKPADANKDASQKGNNKNEGAQE